MSPSLDILPQKHCNPPGILAKFELSPLDFESCAFVSSEAKKLENIFCWETIS
jgi:hypothetical protein